MCIMCIRYIFTHGDASRSLRGHSVWVFLFLFFFCVVFFLLLLLFFCFFFWFWFVLFCVENGFCLQADRRKIGPRCAAVFMFVWVFYLLDYTIKGSLPSLFRNLEPKEQERPLG